MTKKITSLALTAALAFAFAAPAFSQAEKQPAKKQPAPAIPGAGTGGNTPHATTSTVIGPNRNDGSRVTITYGRPFAVHPRKGGEPRKIWGGLVAWDKPDRLGADEATTILTQHPIEIGGATIPAGIHTLYIIPSESGVSKLAFSKKVGDWGVPVNTANDVARVDLKKESLSTPVDQLTIAIKNSSPATMGGTIEISWEKTKFSVPFTVKK
ncbi:MAG: DUF2911 domain-containing protein [Opitutaceae bacterium]|nr:DUF2911 domain-containing protein [Opitutaceae bacterium]